MKAAWILFFGLGIGAVAGAMYLWLPDHSRTDPGRAGTASVASARTPAPVSSTSVASPSAASRLASENEGPARAASITPANIHAIIHAKLRQWRNSATGETTTQEAITQELVGMLSDDNTAGIVRSLSPQERHTPFGSSAVERWLKIAPAEAAGWLAARPDATEHEAWLVARHLREAPAALHVYCDQLPASAWREHVLQHASLGMADTVPGEAITFAEKLVPGDGRINAFETIAYAWFERDAATAFRWVQKVADSALRERLYAVGAKAIARVDPDLALDWLVAGVSADGLFEETALSIVETSAQPMAD